MKGEQKQKKEQELGKELYVLLESNLFLMMTPLKDEKKLVILRIYFQMKY